MKKAEDFYIIEAEVGRGALYIFFLNKKKITL